MAGKEPEWGPTARTVATRTRELRESMNLSFTDLSHRLATLAGWNISPVGIRRIEDMERRVGVDDLAALAIAFDVPTSALLPADGVARACVPEVPVADPDVWCNALVGRIASAIREIRRQRRLSAAGLARLTGEIGYPLTKDQISDLELGRKRTVTVAELIAMAVALGAQPIELIYPDGADGTVQLWPTARHISTNMDARAWFAGRSD